MEGKRAKCRIATLLFLTIYITISALYSLIKPPHESSSSDSSSSSSSHGGCIMTYMYPTYIPISFSPSSITIPQTLLTTNNASSSVLKAKYKLFLYHEGWRKIDFDEHLKKINGVPLLFVPGNGGSYKQVRSLAAESDRAFQGGPLEQKFYREASFTPDGGGDTDEYSFKVPNQYSRRLDWFAVDLEDEHSAMDGQILEEQTEYVVYAIHRILDLYKESRDVRSKEGAETTTSLPRSVILVGHSMGGFVARAAIVHPHLRQAVVETVLTLSSPHQSPPLALQPSLGQYYYLVNQEWRKGYEVELTHTGHQLSDPKLSHIVVVSISGGIRDYQVRSKLESLDGIVPASHRLVIGSTGMRNVWLSMEHQTILWCNQLVVQVSHTLLSLVNPESGQPFPSSKKRLAAFTQMLRSEIPLSFDSQVKSSKISTQVPFKDENDAADGFSPCPRSVYWSKDGLERDLYIEGTTVTVLAMDGRRRWLDIQKSGSDGKNYFIFVTNLAPCSGVRIHLWPEKSKMTSDISPSNRVLEVTSKMVEIPAGPVPMQMEPGSQTEQPPPSAVFQLGPNDMQGFRFLTISVAPRPTVSGRPPPAASMAVGQFYNPEDGKRNFSPGSLLSSIYAQQEILLKEDHPLVLNLSFSISLGLLPVTVSLRTTGCGIKRSGLPVEEAGDVEHSRLCKLRCFPPVAIAWDSTSGLHIIPNLHSETIVVDSSPAFSDSTQESDQTTVLLLVDPHCSFKIDAAVSVTAFAGRFLLLYFSKIIGFSIAVIFFALMRQARAWELDLPLPSLLASVEMNLRMPLSFLLFAVVPIAVSLFSSMLTSQPFPPLISFFSISILCYGFANGLVIILILASHSIIYVAANVHAFIKIRWQVMEESFQFTFYHRFLNRFSSLFSFQAVRMVQGNPAVTASLISIMLVCFVHPALGLLIPLLSHALCCHTALCSYLTASIRSHAREKKFFDSKTKVDERSEQSNFRSNSGFDPLLPLEENPNSPNSSRSYGDTQIETFNHRHGLLILNLLAALMFVPSLVAWFQRIGVGQRLPWFLDSALCVGVILHGLCGSKPEYNFLSFPFLRIQGQQVGLSFVYLLSGYYCYLSGLALAPYRAFYAMAFVGVISTASRILERKYREKGEAYFSASRKHFHRH
ncbi:hypothetical protein AQUCO_09300024v1 [Aquilegia coerulea]|uniref:GPI inositol-deacylase n=1 Tax=Aquilegia coerulea TaxID=218851 RepID=A0A2G5C574_AQUCA|nr:hypothetical protein AQUCO_09300024v1 [Aquilegia coerulea]